MNLSNTFAFAGRLVNNGFRGYNLAVPVNNNETVGTNVCTSLVIPVTYRQTTLASTKIHVNNTKYRIQTNNKNFNFKTFAQPTVELEATWRRRKFIQVTRVNSRNGFAIDASNINIVLVIIIITVIIIISWLRPWQ